MMENGNRKNLYLVTLSVSMVMVALGGLSEWFMFVLSQAIKNDINVDIDENQITFKMMVVKLPGFAVGSLATGYISDRFGRRVSILGSALPIAIGSVVAVFGQKIWLLYITSLTWSCGTGMVSTVSNYYFSEVADKTVRGTLSVITGLMLQIGALLFTSVRLFLSYKALNYIMLVLPFLFFGACWWIPETPYYCLKSGNLEAARRSLRILRGYKDENVLEDELLELKANVINEMSHPSSVKELFVGSRYRTAMIITMGLKVMQIMSGVVVLWIFFISISVEIDFDMDSTLQYIIYIAISITAGLMSAALVDRVGRRPLLLFSYIGTGVTFAAIAIYFYIQEVIKINLLTTFGSIPLFGMILAYFISAIGFNSLIFIPAEIFPMNVRAIAMSFLSVFEIALNLATNVYMFFEMYCGFTVLFSLFTGLALVGSVFCYFLVIETNGKDLRDIQVQLQGKSYYDIDDNLEKVVANDGNEECNEMNELTTQDISK